MKSQLFNKIAVLATYPSDWQLSENEIEEMIGLAERGLQTINGDSASVTITNRQLLLLIKGYVDYEKFRGRI